MAKEVIKDDQETKSAKETTVDNKRGEVSTGRQPRREETPGDARPRRAPGQSGSDEVVERQRRVYFRKKVCRLCVNKVKSVDYKDVNLLRKFITDRGKILPRRITGTCAKHQRMLAKTIKRSRMIALLPFVSK